MQAWMMVLVSGPGAIAGVAILFGELANQVFGSGSPACKWLVLQHVLPKGFRRVRDYGLLHANAKQRLSLLQLVLRVIIKVSAPPPRPRFKCPGCQATMRITGFVRAAWASARLQQSAHQTNACFSQH